MRGAGPLTWTGDRDVAARPPARYCTGSRACRAAAEREEARVVTSGSIRTCCRVLRRYAAARRRGGAGGAGGEFLERASYRRFSNHECDVQVK